MYACSWLLCCGARGSPTAGSQPQPGERSIRCWTKQALVPSLAVSIWMPLARSRYQLRTQRSVYYRRYTTVSRCLLAEIRTFVRDL
jgi:hypothetical protein